MDFNSSKLAWNKSFSAPDISNTGPLFRRVVIEEQYYPHNHNSNVAQQRCSVLSAYGNLSPLPIGASGFPTRHFSCDQLASITADETLDSTFSKPSIIATHTSTPVQVHYENKNFLEIMPDSPMDVDQQEIQESPNATIIKTEKCNAPVNGVRKPTILDFVDLTFQGSTPVLKKKLSPSELTKMPRRKKHSVNKSSKPNKSLFSKINVAIFIIAVLSVPIYDKLNYVRDIELEDFKTNLTNSLVGQSHVVNTLTESMYSFKNGSYAMEKHLISLMGTTGVGKTHCVNVIKRKFMPKQIFEIDIDTFDMYAYRDYLNFYKSVPYLVILDDLTYKHIPKVSNILNALPDNKWILVVAVFNVQETDDFKTFVIDEQLFDKIPSDLFELISTDLVMHNIKFEGFDSDFVQKHLEKFAKVYDDILQNVPNWKEYLGQHDFHTFGFKGLFEKINILSMQ